MCLPCAKEIIDNRTDGALRGAHEVARMLPGMVASGQIGAKEAESRIQALMDLEQKFMDDLADWGDDLVAAAKSPWEV